MVSLGEQMWRSDRTKDYHIIIRAKGHKPLIIPVHTCVLRECSPFFDRALGGPCFFTYFWEVAPHEFPAALPVIRYMYTRKAKDLPVGSYPFAIRSLALKLEMRTLYARAMAWCQPPEPPVKASKKMHRRRPPRQRHRKRGSYALRSLRSMVLRSQTSL